MFLNKPKITALIINSEVLCSFLAAREKTKALIEEDIDGVFEDIHQLLLEKYGERLDAEHNIPKNEADEGGV